MAAIEGTGLSIAFQTGLLGEITDVQGSGMARPAIDTSTFATTGFRTYMPATLADGGEYQVEFHLNPATDPQTAMTAATETVTITWPDVGAATWACDAFATGFSWVAPDGDRTLATITIKVAGDYTVVP